MYLLVELYVTFRFWITAYIYCLHKVGQLWLWEMSSIFHWDWRCSRRVVVDRMFRPGCNSSSLSCSGWGGIPLICHIQVGVEFLQFVLLGWNSPSLSCSSWGGIVPVCHVQVGVEFSQFVMLKLGWNSSNLSPVLWLLISFCVDFNIVLLHCICVVNTSALQVINTYW